MLIWTLLQRWEKLWCADLQSWQINLSSRSPWAILQTQMHRTGHTCSKAARCLVQVAFWRSYTLHQNQRFPPSSSWGIPARNLVQPQPCSRLDTRRFLSAKLSRRVTELRTRFSGKRRILCSSLAVAFPAFRADQQNSKFTQLWIHMNPWCFWYFLLLWNPSNSQGTTVWSAWSWRRHSRNTGLVSFCWHDCKLNAARQLQRNCN